ncbi:hypothetical protein DY000_02042088 [Brassica cretica]|uniref:Uncharacterized protein n=1 Tax=Brassica cretica TaxID=69181 RepID=A0ABQ7BR30_BRACR|nr:hypothetical protein DY000_02042088 [Brassica cretica]
MSVFPRQIVLGQKNVAAYVLEIKTCSNPVWIKHKLSQGNGNVSEPATDRFECDDRNMDRPSSVTTVNFGSHQQTQLVPEIYTKDEINEMVYGVCGEHERNKEAFQMKLDGVYYPLNDSISWLTTSMEEMKQDIARI